MNHERPPGGAAILIIDNDPDFLTTRAEFLRDAGYRVLTADTLGGARQRLSDDYVHLAILDIRMVNEDDDKDTSGLTLAKDPAYRAIPKIILTNYPTYQAVREALGPAMDGLPPAVDFLDKKEGPGGMLRAVEQALAAHVRVNRDLDIQYDAQQRLTAFYLASLLQPDLPNDLLAQRAGELEDLLRRLFYNYRQLRLAGLFWHGNGRLCLPVLARSPQGATDARVVVCGEQEPLAREIDLVQELAPETSRGIRLDSAVYTTHLGAAAYALADANLETVRSLRALFQEGTATQVRLAFEHLLGQVLPAWHGRGQVNEDQDLMLLYRRRLGLDCGALPRAEQERRVDALVQMARSLNKFDIERGPGTLTFRFPKHDPLVCPDPLVTVHGALAGCGSANQCLISPGRLTADSILVDTANRAWLTDFSEAGQAPKWWDYVCLEGVVRFDLSQAPDPLAWLEFEECLTGATLFEDQLPVGDVVADLGRSVVAIQHIRHKAGAQVLSDLPPYRAGLLAWAVAAMLGYEPGLIHTQAEKMRGAHLLLAAGMLARRIQAPPVGGAEPVAAGLRLDPDGVKVRRDGQRLPALGKQGLALFRYLYERAGQVVSRDELVKHVLGEQPVPGDPSQAERLNAAIRRLRCKLEPDAENPSYLVTSRGAGYQLNIDGQ